MEEVFDWWTVDGVESGPAPSEWTDTDALTKPDGVPSGWFLLHTSAFGEDDPLQLRVYELIARRYLRVEMWMSDTCVEAFFVAPKHAGEFLIEKYPTLYLTARQLLASEMQVAQAKTLSAFVRHGHGTSTISQDGLRAPEERE